MEAIKEIHYTQIYNMVMNECKGDIKLINRLTSIMLQMNDEKVGHLSMTDFLKRMMK